MKLRMPLFASVLGLGLMGAAMTGCAGDMNHGDTMKKSMADDTMMAKPAMQEEMKQKEMMEETTSHTMDKMDDKMEKPMDKMETQQ